LLIIYYTVKFLYKIIDSGYVRVFVACFTFSENRYVRFKLQAKLDYFGRCEWKL